MAKNIIIVALALVVIGFIWYVSNNKCFYLPTSGTTDQWGGKYWHAFHSIAERIPCQECRDKGKSFMIYFHDLVNRKLGKKIRDENNFSYWTNFIKNIPSSSDTSTT